MPGPTPDPTSDPALGQAAASRRRLGRLIPAGMPRGVWALGMVSLFMDVSSELVHGLLPVFLVGTLGASAVTVGLIEGVAEATANITKIGSGWLSDRLGRRKALALAGYGLAALVKPLFALAPTIGWVFTARFVDRVGKGIRGAPRDALVGDLVPASMRGAAYGLRQSLDSVGAFLGPLLAIALMAAFADDIRTVFWFAVIPAALSVSILVVWVREPPGARAADGAPPIRFRDVARLGGATWAVIAVGAAIALARFSEAFLVLRVQGAGLPLLWVPMVLVVMSAVYALSALPAGVLSDRVGRRGLLALGCGVLVAADAVLALAPNATVALAGVALWGLHMGLTQGLLAALVADAAPAGLRGSAFGMFNLVSGVVALAASALAGVLWEWLSPAAPFVAGAAFTVLALGGVALLRPPRPSAARG